MLQYWHGERRTLLTWRGGYHGDTFGAMAVCDPDGGMHSMWKGTLARARLRPAARVDPRMAGCGHPTVRDEHPRGRDRRADRAGCGRDALPSARMRPAPPRSLHAARDPARAGRDRDRVRPHRHAVRGGRARRHPLPRQGPDGRLHDAGGDALHGGGRGAPERAAHARADLHGQPAGDRRRAGVNQHPPERFVAGGCCAHRTRIVSRIAERAR